MSGVADTSIDAYRAHTVRDLSDGRRRVMAYIRPGVDFTRNEIAKGTGMPINVVTPRVRELLDRGELEQGPRRLCSGTGNGANPVRLPVKQLELAV